MFACAVELPQKVFMHVNANPQSISLLTKKTHQSDTPFCHQTYTINVHILCSVSSCSSMNCPFVAHGSHETQFRVFAVALIMACVEVQDNIQYLPAHMFLFTLRTL
jgi:hypothetical protein